MRGIDHIGLTVPSVDEATRFLAAAFDATVLYDTLPASGPSRGGAVTTSRLGVAADVREERVRMLRLPDGPGIELFEFRAEVRHDPAVPSDLGWQHVALYVDDVAAALARAVGAGASALGEPRPLPGPEAGPDNVFVYLRAPWGATIELVSYPSPQPYEAGTALRRWRPAASGSAASSASSSASSS